MTQTIPFPTPADVKAEPISAKWITAFAAVPDAKVQKYINTVAERFGSSEVLMHTQRNEAVLYGAAHLLALKLMSEGEAGSGGGAGGLSGPLSGVKLDGVGTKSFATTALQPEDIGDWLMQKSPWLTCLVGVIDTFPPSIYVTGMGDAFNGLEYLGL